MKAEASGVHVATVRCQLPTIRADLITGNKRILVSLNSVESNYVKVYETYSCMFPLLDIHNVYIIINHTRIDLGSDQVSNNYTVQVFRSWKLGTLLMHKFE